MKFQCFSETNIIFIIKCQENKIFNTVLISNQDLNLILIKAWILKIENIIFVVIIFTLHICDRFSDFDYLRKS